MLQADWRNLSLLRQLQTPPISAVRRILIKSCQPDNPRRRIRNTFPVLKPPFPYIRVLGITCTSLLLKAVFTSIINKPCPQREAMCI